MSGEKPIADAGEDPPSDADLSFPPNLNQVELSSHPSAPRAVAAGPAFSPGDLLLNRFRILRFIGKGGMGEVFEAEDLDLQSEHVAVKTVLPAIAANPQMIAQFKREIQLSRKVTHENVCRIFDLVYEQRPSGPVAFLTMELLEGEPLSTLIRKKGAQPLPDVLPLAQQMAEGLNAAHKAGIIHQDFKPGNVMVVPGKDGDGPRAVITDFGLAQNVREAAAQSGRSVGTPAYMAPEQVEGKPVSPSTDVYAFGVVLYELLTGHWPYNAKTPQELKQKKLNESPVLPTRYVPELSPEVERVLLRCLARAPEQRFASTLEVVEALAPRRTLRRNLAIAALVLVLLAAAGIWKWRSMVAAREPTVAVIGFTNNSAAEYDWLSTELSETLAADLAASPQIHVAPSEDVARVKVEMSVPPSGSLAREDPSQVRSALGANYLVSGGYTVASSAGDRLSLDVKLQSPSSDGNADFHASGTEGDYRKLVADIAAQLRKSLGATRALSADAADAQNIYPQDPDARRLYFQALDKLRAFDAPAAAELLQQASKKENTNVAIHSALADAWSQLRFDPKAAKEAQIAADLAQNNSASLPLEYVDQTTARAAEMNKKFDNAANQYRTLWNKYHRLNYGLRLASVLGDGGKLDPCPGKEQQPCGGPAAALKVLDQLKAMPAPLGTDPRIQMGYARTYGAMTKPHEQLAAAQAAFDEAKRRGSQMMQANAQLELCWAYRSQSDVDKASTPCNQAHDMFIAIGDKISGAVALNDLATLLADRGRNAEALPIFDRVIATNQAAGATRDYAGANVNAAMTAIMLGKTQEAQEYLDVALKAAQQVGDKYDEGRVHIMRAELLAGAQKLQEAESEAKQALALAKDAQDEEMQSSALMKIGEYQEKTNPQAALKTYEEVLRMRRKNNDQRGVATCLNNMGELLLDRGDLNAAEQHFQESQKIFNDLKMNNAAAQDLLSLAEVDFRRKNLPAAESKARKALQAFQDPGHKDPDSEQAATSLLAKIHKAN